MALSRLVALKNLSNYRFIISSSPSPCPSFSPALRAHRLPSYETILPKRFSATANDKPEDAGEVVSVSSGGTDLKSSPDNTSERGLRRRRDDRSNFPLPALSGLGNAILQAAHEANRALGNLSPWQLIRKFKEKEECYELKYEMPGLSKEELKITVEDGVLVIRGEHREDEEEESDDEYWSASRYGYYNTSLSLPEDAKVDEIKAELKHGMLRITIPKDVGKKREFKQVQIE